jgi:hypothetical protein
MILIGAHSVFAVENDVSSIIARKTGSGLWGKRYLIVVGRFVIKLV